VNDKDLQVIARALLDYSKNLLNQLDINKRNSLHKDKKIKELKKEVHHLKELLGDYKNV
jgi:ribosomal protein S9